MTSKSFRVSQPRFGPHGQGLGCCHYLNSSQQVVNDLHQAVTGTGERKTKECGVLTSVQYV